MLRDLLVFYGPGPNLSRRMQQYEKYLSANAVENGGSFYLQSKVYRAKEQLDEFMKEKRMEEKQAKGQ